MRSSNNYSSCGTDEKIALERLDTCPTSNTRSNHWFDSILGPRLCSQQSQSTKPVSQGVSHRVLLTRRWYEWYPKHSLNTEFWSESPLLALFIFHDIAEGLGLGLNGWFNIFLTCVVSLSTTTTLFLKGKASLELSNLTRNHLENNDTSHPLISFFHGYFEFMQLTLILFMVVIKGFILWCTYLSKRYEYCLKKNMSVREHLVYPIWETQEGGYRRPQIGEVAPRLGPLHQLPYQLLAAPT